MLKRRRREAPRWLMEEFNATPMQRIAVVCTARYLTCVPILLVLIAAGLVVNSLVTGSPMAVAVGVLTAVTAVGFLAGLVMDILADLSLLFARGRDSRLGWSRSTSYWRVVFRLVRELVASS